MKGGNRNLFRLTRFVLLKLPFVFGLLARFRKPRKRILIIKTDAIGDYILFRNFLEVITQANEFKGYSFTLLGNKLWQGLALEYDSAFINDFIFTNPEGLYQSPLKTLQLGWRLFKNGYAVVLQPSYTRLLITDGLAALTAAPQIIGFDGDHEGILPRYKIKTDKFYTQRFILPENINFEFYRGRFFFESVLQRSVDVTSPSIGYYNVNGQTIVIFPGSGHLKRSWDGEKFLQIIRLIIAQNSASNILLAGGPADAPLGEYLMQNLPKQNINNLIGKTSLVQLVELIGHAGLVISNETSAVHIAAATKTKSVCLLGGGHFGRFAPYPGEMSQAPFFIYEKMPCYNCNWICKFEKTLTDPFPCILAISIEKVWPVISRLLATYKL